MQQLTFFTERGIKRSKIVVKKGVALSKIRKIFLTGMLNRKEIMYGDDNYRFDGKKFVRVNPKWHG